MNIKEKSELFANFEVGDSVLVRKIDYLEKLGVVKKVEDVRVASVYSKEENFVVLNFGEYKESIGFYDLVEGNYKITKGVI